MDFSGNFCISLSNGMVVCVLPKVGVVWVQIVTARGSVSDRDFREKTAFFRRNTVPARISVKKHKSRNPLLIRQKIRLFIGTISRHLPLEIAVSGGGYMRSSNWAREHVRFEERNPPMEFSTGILVFFWGQFGGLWRFRSVTWSCKLRWRQANPKGKVRKFKIRLWISAHC